MKTLEELTGTITTTSIADMVPRVILNEVEEAARARRFGRNLIRINDDLTRTKGRSIIIGRRGTLTAASVNEGAKVTGSDITYTSNTITPTKVGVAVHITQESIEGCELNLIKDSVTEAGIALADKEDSDIIKALLSYTATTASLSTTNTINVHSGAPLVYVDETVVGLSLVDYGAGRLVGSSGTLAVTCWYTSYTVGDAGSGAVITDALETPYTWAANAYEIISNAVTAVKARKWSPKFLLIHPNALNGLLKSSMFVDAAKYGSNVPILTGEIGSIAGLKTLVTTQMPAGAALVIDPNRAAWMAVRRNLDMKRWDNPQTDSIELYFYVEYGVSVTDSDALQVIVNITDISSDVI